MLVIEVNRNPFGKTFTTGVALAVFVQVKTDGSGDGVGVIWPQAEIHLKVTILAGRAPGVAVVRGTALKDDHFHVEIVAAIRFIGGDVVSGGQQPNLPGAVGQIAEGVKAIGIGVGGVVVSVGWVILTPDGHSAEVGKGHRQVGKTAFCRVFAAVAIHIQPDEITDDTERPVAEIGPCIEGAHAEPEAFGPAVATGIEEFVIGVVGV